MPDLAVGETIEMKGSGSKPYLIKNCGGGGYSCTCPAWRNQSIDPRIRTCKHIRKLRGDAAEQARIGSVEELPSRTPEGEAKVAPAVLLAEKWDGETNVTGWWMSEKLDGLRAYWDGRQFISRNGNLFLAPEWFLAGLPAVPLDGELWITRKKFTLAQGIAMSQTRGEEWRQMRFLIYDAPAHGGEFEARLRFIDDLVGRARPAFATPLEQQQCRSLDHLRSELERVEALGGEGLMLRQPGSKYEAGRSSTLLKVKTFHTDDAVVIGHQAGEGRHKGRLGALIARTADGIEFRIGTGLSDAERGSPPSVGSVVTFKYQELTELGVPRFPVYVGVRKDTSAATTPVAAPVVKVRKKEATVSVPAVPPPALPDLVRRFHYPSEPVRFWEVALYGLVARLSFGTTGGATQTKEHAYPTAQAARAAIEEQIADKLDDGFIEVDRLSLQPLTAAKPAPAAAAPAPAAPAGVRHFEFVEGTSSKYWEVWVEGNEVRTRYGRIGSQGSTTIKKLPDEAAARVAADKLVREKTGKGYVEK
jgi:DNA ligase-1